MANGSKATICKAFLLVAALAVTVNGGINRPALADGLDDGQKALLRGDESDAIRSWTPLATSGNSEAQYRLGMMYLLGWGIVADQTTAVKWLEMAAAQSHDGASLALSRLYLDPQKEIYDPEAGINLLRASAQRGVVEAERELGYYYRHGGMVPQDFNEAANWLKQAASKGDIQSEAGLAELYRYGYGVPQNYSRALMWYSLAAGTPTNNLPEYIKAATAARIARDEVSAIASEPERAEAERLAIACWKAELKGCNEANQ